MQRNRYSVLTHVQKGQSPSAATNGKTCVKLSIVIDSRGCLITIEETKFEAKRPRAGPYSHGYRCQKCKWELGISRASGPRARRTFMLRYVRMHVRMCVCNVMQFSVMSCIYAFMYVCNVCTYVCVYVCMHTCMHTYVHAYVHEHT